MHFFPTPLQFFKEKKAGSMEFLSENLTPIDDPSPAQILAQHKHPRCIVKLGGAAITCKNELEKINKESLRIVSSQLREAMRPETADFPAKILGMDWSRRPGDSIDCIVDFDEDSELVSDGGFIIVHGAGSFGHFQASRSGVNKGGLNLPLVKAGFVATRISVTSLNLEIVRTLARVWLKRDTYRINFFAISQADEES